MISFLEAPILQKQREIIIQMRNSQIDAKRQEFRVQIRRKQLNELFANQRLRLIEQSITQQHQQMMRHLDTHEKRAQWVNSIAVQLVQHPCAEWAPILRQISISVRAFDQNFQLWIKTGIIRALVELFKQEWIYLGFTKLAANILTDIFYQLPRQSEQINEILNYQFCLDLIELCCAPMEDVTQYYQLMNTMIDDRPSLRDKLIKNGIVQILTKKLKAYTDFNSDEVYFALGLVGRLVKIYANKNSNVHYTPNGNVISIFIPVFQFYLNNCTRTDCYSIILKALCNITELQRQALYKTIMTSKSIVKIVLDIMSSSNIPEHRLAAASIIYGLLYSNNNEYSEQLIHRGVLDIILNYARRCDQENKRNHRLSHVYLKVISNIVATSIINVESVLRHQVFGEFVLSCTHVHDTNTKDMREQAFYIIQTIVSYNSISYITMEALVSKYKILEVLTLGLQVAYNPADILLQILTSLYRIIKFYDSVFTGSTNKVIDILQRFYNISTTLLKLESEMQNKKVQSKISQLFAVIHGGE